MSVEYAYEKYLRAIHELATGYGPLPIRLRDAATQLIRLRDTDLPNGEIREVHKGIHEDVVRESHNEEGEIGAPSRFADEAEAQALTERIFDLFLSLRPTALMNLLQ
jgi:hypothetical protein